MTIRGQKGRFEDATYVRRGKRYWKRTGRQVERGCLLPFLVLVSLPVATVTILWLA